MTDLQTSVRSGWQEEGPPGESRPVPASLQDLARQDDAGPYAIIDGARDDRLYRELSEGGVAYEPLYRGMTEKFFAVSPILARCEAGSPLFRWLTSEAWGQGLALYLTSRASLERLADHFARFTVVRTEDDERLFFRFYDPRVLQVYLQACTVPQRELLFGPAELLAAECESGAGLLLFDRTGGGLGPVQDSAPPPPDEPRISPALLEVFSDYMMRQFIDAMVVSLRAADARLCDQLGQDRLRKLIGDGTRRAREHGVLLERDVERYLQFLMRHGEDFGQQATGRWALDILTARGVSGTVKMNRVEAREAQLAEGRC